MGRGRCEIKVPFSFRLHPVVCSTLHVGGCGGFACYFTRQTGDLFFARDGMKFSKSMPWRTQLNSFAAGSLAFLMPAHASLCFVLLLLVVVLGCVSGIGHVWLSGCRCR